VKTAERLVSRLVSVGGHKVPGDRRGGHVLKFAMPEIIFGVGTLREVGCALWRLGGSRALVVSDPGVMAADWVDRALPSLAEAGVDYRLWYGVTPNPKDHEVHAGFEVFAENECDTVLAIGGGSVIDAAKGVAILAGNGGSILDYEGIDKVTRPIPPMVMVPSTGGTGADVSQFCDITDTAGRLKRMLVGRALVADISVTDPTLLSTLPPEVAAWSGMDALTHAVEAYTSKAANFLSDGHALTAIRLIAKWLPRAVHDANDLEAREAMARASLQAGLAFTNAILGATHAMSHQIGGALDLPHGLTNAVLLPHVMRFNAAHRPERFADVGRALGVSTPAMRPAESAEAAVEEVFNLGGRVGIPRRLSEIGVTSSDLHLFIDNALNDPCILTNPRPVVTKDIEDIFLAAL
jgi:alcohol dehydrogenase